MVIRAARLSIQLNLSAGTLEDLEREMMPVAVAQTRRPVFRRALVELKAQVGGDSELDKAARELGAQSSPPAAR